MSIQIQIRRDSESNWSIVNPTLAQGEQGLETDTNKVKIGDGVTAWNSLAYFGGGAPGGVDTSIQWNDGSGFCGNCYFTYDDSMDLFKLSSPNSCYSVNLLANTCEQFYVYDSMNYVKRLSAGYDTMYSVAFLRDNCEQGLFFNDYYYKTTLQFNEQFFIQDKCGNSYINIDKNMSTGHCKIQFGAYPTYYCFPITAGNPGQILALDGNYNLEWSCQGSGASAGCQFDIQVGDGSAGFVGCDLFQYNYCDHYLCLKSCCGTTGPVMHVYSCDNLNMNFELLNTCEMNSCNFNYNFILTPPYMGCGSRFNICECGTPNKLEYNVSQGLFTLTLDDYMSMNDWQAFIGFDGTCCNAPVRFEKYQCAKITLGCCQQSSIHGELCGNDYFNLQNSLVGYNSCCNLQWKTSYENLFNNGWIEWITSGTYCGLVISADACNCSLPLVLAQGYINRVELGADGYFRTNTPFDICCGVACIGGTAPATDGTYSSPTSITIKCGLITAIS